MSLRVWIPFTDGTEKNQGTSNLTFTNSNSSKTYSSDSGKLGKCFYNNGYYNQSGLISNENITLPVTQSWFCWAKFDSFGSSASLNGVVTNHDYANKKNMGITVLYLSSTTGKLSCNTGTGSSRTYNTYTGNTTLNAGTWYHIGFTYDGSNIRFYVNGELDGTTAYSGLSLVAAKIGVFRWDAMTENTYNMHGSLNDIRIYDHCLTSQEVKELAKGLVCHYTLGSASLASDGNLINGLAGGGLCTVSGNSINISGTNSDTYFYIKTTRAMVSGKLYRLSCIGSGFPESALYNFPIAGQSNTGPGLIKIKNGPCMLTFVANDACANAGTLVIMDDTSRSAGAGAISGFRLEKLDRVSDSSGYCKNAEVVGNLTLVTSPRYDKGVTMTAPGYNLSSTYTYLLGPVSLTSPNQMSVSFWFKGSTRYRGGVFCTSVNTGFDDYTATAFHDYDSYIETRTSNGTYRLDSSNWILNGTWHHYVLVYSGSDLKFYRDGTCVLTISASGTLTTFNYIAFNYGCAGGGKRSINGAGYSDCRIYATALSADDVKDLYSLGALVTT